LGWSQQYLSDKAIVSLNAVTRLEKGKVDSRISTITAIEKTLTKAGVEILADRRTGRRYEAAEPKGVRTLCDQGQHRAGKRIGPKAVVPPTESQ
jgi:transcriptional regulator with XRE-family HTH domain